MKNVDNITFWCYWNTWVAVILIDWRLLQLAPIAMSDLSVIRGQLPKFKLVSSLQFEASEIIASSSTLIHRLNKTVSKNLHDKASSHIDLELIFSLGP